MKKFKVNKNIWHQEALIDVEDLPRFLEQSNDLHAVFYVGFHSHSRVREGKLDFINYIAKYMASKGLRPILVSIPWKHDIILHEKTAVHFYLADRIPPINSHERLFFLHQSPLNNYWYMDQTGARNNSSIPNFKYRPARINYDDALSFYHKNKPKPPASYQDVEEELPEKFILITAQNFKTSRDKVRYIPYKKFIRQIIKHCPDTPIVIKPHPTTNLRTMKLISQFYNGTNVFISQAPLNQLWDRALVNATVNSTTPVEAMFHSVPSIICGPMPFQQGCMMSKDLRQLRRNLNKYPIFEMDYVKFLYWFHEIQCYSLESEQTQERVEAAFHHLNL